ncbi:MAG: PHP domain-containing protein [Spirochaetes bacterium]|nr:PHP domain-containing protein [Spirochaetota bacterium]
MLKTVSADLHIHTCLSPCASLDMTPRKIVGHAREAGLSIIAVTDHNSAENVPAVEGAAAGTGLYVIPGIEINTVEEVHVLGLFQSCRDALEMQNLVFGNLTPGENDENLFGLQVIANERDEVEGFNRRLLVGSTSLNVNRTVEWIHRYHGIAVFSHIDREVNSIIGQLGFIPGDIPIDGIEISRNLDSASARLRFSEYGRYPMITSSDSHELEDIGSARTMFTIEELNFSEIRMAFAGRDGRAIANDQY